MTDTYPSECWPSDADVEALNGTTDEATGLEYLALGLDPTSSPSLRVRYDRLLQRLHSILAPLRQGQVVHESGLKFGVYPLTYRLGGANKHFDGETNQSLSDNTTTCVWIDSANALQTGASFPGDITTYMPLAVVTTSGGTVTQIEDKRVEVMWEVAAS